VICVSKLKNCLSQRLFLGENPSTLRKITTYSGKNSSTAFHSNNWIMLPPGIRDAEKHQQAASCLAYVAAIERDRRKNGIQGGFDSCR
jgi:hypothetical protein